MSLPDDEIREPEDHLTPDETSDESSGEQPVSDSDFDPEAFTDSSLEPDLAEAEPGPEDLLAGDEAGFAEAPSGEDETLDFAAPADMESGIGFQSMDSAGGTEVPEQAAGDELFAGFADGTDEFAAEKAETGDQDEAAEDAQEEGKEKPGQRVQRIVAAIGKSDPYTVLMGIALLALLAGILFFYMELSSYNFDIWAERARQLFGTLSFGWLG